MRFDALYGRALLFLVLALAAVRFWRSPWSASELKPVPDSVEYAIGAQRLVTLGRYDLEIEGIAYPPRYTPWTSLFLAPAYALAPRELGIGILPVFALALSGVGAAFVLGRRLAGDWGAVGAAVALACYGVYRHASMNILTDAPAAALVLWGCVLYSRLRRGDDRMAVWCMAGAVCAAAFALRTELLALILPFAMLALRAGRRLLHRATLLLAPSAAIASATAIYNHATFGSWIRGGYQFWCPIPCDYRALVLSSSFFPANAATLLSFWGLTAIGFGSLGAGRLLRSHAAEARPVFAFLVLGALPGSLLHLFYFYPHVRFHLPALSLLCVLAGAGLAAILPEAFRRRTRWALWPIALLPIVLPASPAPVPYRRITADALAALTPVDAVIVTAIEPVYLEPSVLRGTARRVVPIGRWVEYAARTVADERIDLPEEPPRWPLEGDALETFQRRTRRVCAFTAEEDPGRIAAWVRSNVPVYLDSSFLPESFPLERILGGELELVPIAGHDWLSRIALRP